jgi:hypothetical protein
MRWHGSARLNLLNGNPGGRREASAKIEFEDTRSCRVFRLGSIHVLVARAWTPLLPAPRPGASSTSLLGLLAISFATPEDNARSRGQRSVPMGAVAGFSRPSR